MQTLNYATPLRRKRIALGRWLIRPRRITIPLAMLLLEFLWLLLRPADCTA